MKDGYVSAVTEKQSLQSMLVTKNVLLDTIYESDGEINDEQLDSLMQLEGNILSKVDGWAWTLKKNGAIDKEIELWQQRKEVIEGIIKTLRNGKEKLKARAHHVMQMNSMDRIDGNQFWIKRDFSKTKSLMLDQVEGEFKKYELPVLNNNQYRLLLNMIDNFNGTLNKDLPFDSIYTAIEVQEKIKNETTAKCNVSDLAIDHCAIVIEEKPTIKIYSKK